MSAWSEAGGETLGAVRSTAKHADGSAAGRSERRTEGKGKGKRRARGAHLTAPVMLILCRARKGERYRIPSLGCTPDSSLHTQHWHTGAHTERGVSNKVIGVMV